jgi:hypothetical protein
VLENPNAAADREGAKSLPLNLRSKITNGTKMIHGVDGRSAEARRYRDLAMSFADDAGGAAGLTEAQRSLIASAASLTIQAERMQGAMLRGEPVDVEQQTRVANVLARTLSRLGKRAPPDAGPTLADYLEAAHGDAAA